VSVEEFLRTIKEVTMSEQFSKYYTPEQLQQLAERRGVVGEQRIREVEAEWKEPSVQNQYGHKLMPEMFAYVTKAVEASKKP
jgi:hypothetical protein